MANSGTEHNPLDQLRALRSEVIDRERSRVRTLLGDASSSVDEETRDSELSLNVSQDASGAVEADETAPNPTPETLEPVERKPKRGKSSRKSAVLEGDEARIRISPEIRRLLSLHCHHEGWSLDDLISHAVRHTLSARSPAIYQDEWLLASHNICRFWSRHPLETNLNLVSDRGTFLVTTNTSSASYLHWKSHFVQLGLPDPDLLARQMRLFQLQEQMISVEDFDALDWRKEISKEDYVVTQAVVAEQEATPG